MSRNRLILSGERFGKLAVISEDGRIGRHLVAYKCLCDCGKTIRCSGYDLLTRGKISCGCQKGVGRAEKYIGKTFNNLTILSIDEYHRDTGSPTKVFCLCSCGTKKSITLLKVVSGHTKSCGHLSYIGTIDDSASGFSVVLSRYKGKSSRRGIQFDLTDNCIKEMVKRNCYYCGSEPSSLVSKRGKPLLSYNGIDRKDNSIGYTEDNCVTCCAICNRAKHTMDVSDFTRWIKRIKNYNDY